MLAAAVGAGSAGAQEVVPTFADAVVFEAGSFPYGLAAADLLGDDGLPEIVVANGGVDVPSLACGTGDAGTVSVFRNTGSWETNPGGGLVLEQTIAICDECVPAEIAVADIDMADGPDLIISAAGANGPGVYVCYNDGTGHYPDIDVVYFPTPLPVRGLVARDFDNDGWIDVAAGVDWCNLSDDTDIVCFLFNDQSGSFNTNDPNAFKQVDLGTTEGLPPCDIAAADFFRLTLGPPLQDVVSANMWSDSFTEVRNLGNRVLNAHTSARPGGCVNGESWLFETITSGRFDANSFDDFAVTEFDADVVDVFLGNGAGGYTSFCDNPALRIQLHPDSPNAFCWGVENGHLNGPANKVDLVATLVSRDVVSVLLGRGDGTFQTLNNESGYLFSVEPPGGPSNEAEGPILVIVADMDQDGFGDIVTTNHFTDNISVLINEMTIQSGGGS